MARKLEELLAELQRLPQTQEDLGRALAPEMIVLALEAEADAKQRATVRPHPRSGRLRQSIQGMYDPDGFRLVLRSGGRVRGRDVRYAKAQDLGATIRPKRRKYLAIPLRAAKTAAGVARYATARVDPTEMFVSKTRKAGTDLLLRDVRTGEPRYLLTKGPITVRATRFLTGAGEAMAEALPAALDRAFTRLLSPG